MIRNLLLICCALINAATTDTHAQSFTASGTFSLPAGFVSTQGDITYRVSTEPLQEFEVNGSTVQSSSVITIPRFGRTTNYVLTLQDNPSPDEFNLVKFKFECLTGCSSVPVTSVGFWSEDDGVVGQAEATDFSTEDDLIVDILLQRGDVYSGTIKLPEELTASGDEQIELSLRASGFNQNSVFSISIDTEESDMEWPFFIAVPQVSSIGGWNMELICDECDEDIPEDTHYPTQATGDPLTLANNESFFFRKFVSFNNMNLTFLSTSENGRSIGAGTLLLLLDEDEG